MHLAFVNGDINRGDDSASTDRLFVSDGVVREWPSELPRGTETIDLRGGYLGPSFTDGHAHPFLAGREALGPNLRGCSSVIEIVDAIESWASRHPDDEWIVAGSYDATIVRGGLFDARWLDTITRPVVLRAWDYHTVWCNSRALELADLTAETPDPSHGRIVRRSDGSPLGTLLESAANLILDLVPAEPLATQVEFLEAATQELASHGITWAQEAWSEASQLPAWFAAARAERLAIDVDLAQRADPTRWPAQITELVDARSRAHALPGITMDTIKFFVDGIIENHTASMLHDYADACTRGMPNWSETDLARALGDVHAMDFDIHIHAIGDAGVRTALNAISVLRRLPLGWARRVTIAHAQVIDSEDLHRFAALDVTVCFQPLWARPDEVMTSLTLPRLGDSRALQYQLRSVLDSGARITFGSDWPVSSANVLEAIQTAVTRQNLDGTPTNGWYPDERLRVDQAFTAASAALVEQSRHGADRRVLHPGARADLVWLSHDPRSQTPERISNIQVHGTWLSGHRTHEGARIGARVMSADPA